eukprot:3939540-Rhodomonas_salina.2
MMLPGGSDPTEAASAVGAGGREYSLHGDCGVLHLNSQCVSAHASRALNSSTTDSDVLHTRMCEREQLCTVLDARMCGRLQGVCAQKCARFGRIGARRCRPPIPRSPVPLRASYAMPGTDLVYCRVCLRVRYAMPLAYGTWARVCDEWY